MDFEAVFGTARCAAVFFVERFTLQLPPEVSVELGVIVF